MKLITSLLLLISFSGHAATCAQKVQKQIEEVYQTGYYVEIQDDQIYKLKDMPLMSEYLYIHEEAAIHNPETAVYRAESSAAGCYGYELVLFRQSDCQLLAIGGGYCD